MLLTNGIDSIICIAQINKTFILVFSDIREMCVFGDNELFQSNYIPLNFDGMQEKSAFRGGRNIN